MNDDFDIDGDLFMRVRRAQGSEETRYYLRGVYIEPYDGGALMVATDGRAMLVAHDPRAKAPRSAIVSLAVTEAEKSDCDEWDCDECDCAMPPIDYGNTRLRFTLPGPAVATFCRHDSPWRHAIAEEVKGKFPDWRKALRKPAEYTPRRGHEAYGIDPGRLARMTGDASVALDSLGEGRPTLVHFDGRGAIFGALMPHDLTQVASSRDLAAAFLSEPPAEVGK